MAQSKIKKKEVKAFVNPFTEGINYTQFLDAVGNKSLAEYCKGKLTSGQIEWLKNDIKLIKK